MMAYREPKQRNAGLDVYEMPVEKKTYFMSCDVSRGTKNDYSAFVVLMCHRYHTELLQSLETMKSNHYCFHKIYDVARAYNQAFVMIEVNDIGEQVANTMQFDLEYDNLVMASMRGRAGQITEMDLVVNKHS